MELIGGILACLTPEYLAYAVLGCLVGTLVGVMPGIGAASAVAILFPFTVVLPPTGMLIALAAIYYGAQYGGSTTAVLVNVPGEVSSVVTALDGYPMARQGRAGPALAISAIVSFMAGIAGALLIATVGPTVAGWALAFGPAEYLGLGLLSLVAISALSGPSLLKGVIVTLLGMLLVAVGIDDSSGLQRLTFGQPLLLEGLELVPMMIGLFGIGEVLKTVQEKTQATLTGRIGRLLPDRQELRAGLKAGGRATAVSLVLGLFPGMMPSIGSFIAYAIERNAAKDPSRFGHGAIEGVAASEAANNGTAMANLVPMLSLGIPTGPTTALMIAAVTMYGMQPGPLLFTQQPTLVWTLIGSFFVANAILLVLNLPLVGLWVRLARIPYPLLAPLILVTCLVGAYTTRNSVFDLWVCVGAGLVGWAMSSRGWPLAPLILAYVLGPMIERSARQVIAISPSMLLGRPVFWLCIALGVATIWFARRMAVAQQVTD